MGIIMGTFDLFGIIESIIDPTSSYKEMQDKIESNKEETINDCETVGPGQDSNAILTDFVNDVSESVEPEDDYKSLVMDIKNDFDDDSDADDTEGINSVDADVD